MFVFDGEASSERETINRWESLGMNRWGPIIGDRGSEGQKNMGLRRVFWPFEASLSGHEVFRYWGGAGGR